MTQLKFRQGTIYKNLTTQQQILVINHNPMNLQSIIVCSENSNNSLNLAQAQIISIDYLIEIRKNNNFQDMGDLPKEELHKIISILISSNLFSDFDKQCLKNLLIE